VTFTATAVGSNVTFDVASSETQAYGALGPEYLAFGNGASEGFATPEYCLAQPVAETNDRQISYSYSKPGSYTASVTVGANCTPDQLTLSLPITVS
jgi:PKD repeat protein